MKTRILVLCAIVSFFGHLQAQQNQDIFLNGDQMLVNQTVLQNQKTPSVAIQNDGKYIIVWSDEVNGERAVFTRKYDVNNNPLTGEVNITGDLGNCESPIVVMNGSGKHVIVWRTRRGGGAPHRLYMKVYDDFNDNQAAAIIVDQASINSHDMYNHDVHINENGEFAITWASSQDLTNANHNNEIFLQLYDNANQIMLFRRRIDALQSGGGQLIGALPKTSVDFDEERRVYLSWQHTIFGTTIKTRVMQLQAGNGLVDINPTSEYRPIEEVTNFFARKGAQGALLSYLNLGIKMNTRSAPLANNNFTLYTENYLNEVRNPKINISKKTFYDNHVIGFSNANGIFLGVKNINDLNSSIKLMGTGGNIQRADVGMNAGLDTPHIAINRVGRGVVVWAANGLDGDNAQNSNIYARAFVSLTPPSDISFVPNENLFPEGAIWEETIGEDLIYGYIRVEDANNNIPGTNTTFFEVDGAFIPVVNSLFSINKLSNLLAEVKISLAEGDIDIANTPEYFVRVQIEKRFQQNAPFRSGLSFIAPVSPTPLTLLEGQQEGDAFVIQVNPIEFGRGETIGNLMIAEPEEGWIYAYEIVGNRGPLQQIAQGSSALVLEADLVAGNTYEVEIATKQLRPGSNPNTARVRSRKTLRIEALANNAPEITGYNGVNALDENINYQEAILGAFSAQDADNDELSYSIANVQPAAFAQYFSMDSNELILNGTFDYEGPMFLNAPHIVAVTVSVSDGSAEDEFTINFTISDQNDAPVVTAYNGTREIDENEEILTVGSFEVIDQDFDILTWSVFSVVPMEVANQFSIDGNRLLVNGSFDYEVHNQISIVIRFSDGTVNTDYHLDISINNINEAPQNLAFEGRDVNQLSINLSFETALNSEIIGLDAEDPEDDALIFSFADNNHPFVINGDKIMLGDELGDAGTVYETEIMVGDGNTVSDERLLFTVRVVDTPLALEASELKGLKIFPNPVKDVLQIELPKEQSFEKLVIENLLGEKITTGTIQRNNKRMSMSTQHLPQGVYILKLYNAEGKTYFKKIVKS